MKKTEIIQVLEKFLWQKKLKFSKKISSKQECAYIEYKFGEFYGKLGLIFDENEDFFGGRSTFIIPERAREKLYPRKDLLVLFSIRMRKNDLYDDPLRNDLTYTRPLDEDSSSKDIIQSVKDVKKAYRSLEKVLTKNF